MLTDNTMQIRKQRIVIIGGTAAGTAVAAAIARNSARFDITLVEQSEFIAVGLCSTPHFISRDIQDYHELLHFTPETFQKKYNVRVLTNVRALKIDTLQRNVSCKDLKNERNFQLPYERLVIATGAIPYRLDILGKDAANLFTINNLNSAIELRNFINKHSPKNVVIVGGGAIGIGFADRFVKMGMKVFIVELNNQIMNNCDIEVAASLENSFNSPNLTIIKNNSVVEYIKENNNCVALRIQPDNTTIPANLVIEAIGVKPETTLAQNAGIQIGHTGAIRVDQSMRTSQFNVFAAGDCVELRNIVSGKPGYYPLGSNANKCGRILGEIITGKFSRCKGVTGTLLLKSFGIEIGTTGLNLKEAEKINLKPLSVTIKAPTRVKNYPNSDTINIKLIFTKEQKILGGQLFGKDGVTGRTQVLAMAINNSLSLSDIAETDFGYTPPLSTPWDPLVIAARSAINKCEK